MGNRSITNLSAPKKNSDAATKAYVDDLRKQVNALEDILMDQGLYSLKDIEGNTYKVVRLGNQVWMAENLKTTKFANGDDIPTTVPADLDISSVDDPRYQWPYGGDENNVATYGRLYTFYAAYDNRNICPAGWHVPTSEEWRILELFLGIPYDQIGSQGVRGTNEGSKLAGNAALWVDGNLKNDPKFDSTGFSALPGGYRSSLGSSAELGEAGYWWTSSFNYMEMSWCRYMKYNSSMIYLSESGWRKCGFSVRCLRD
ncbi:MAG: hypothetical protein HC906_06070 [Bacteroidales bacterium]|nr:hypothetical protein [Bacteroidales bacterium]